MTQKENRSKAVLCEDGMKPLAKSEQRSVSAITVLARDSGLIRVAASSAYIHKLQPLPLFQ
jgi:hypothetical protein